MFWWAWRGVAFYWMRGSLADRITIFPVIWALVVALTVGDHLTWQGFILRGGLAWLVTSIPVYVRAYSRARAARLQALAADPHSMDSRARRALTPAVSPKWLRLSR
jgi:hypothetical protein